MEAKTYFYKFLLEELEAREIPQASRALDEVTEGLSWTATRSNIAVLHKIKRGQTAGIDPRDVVVAARRFILAAFRDLSSDACNGALDIFKRLKSMFWRHADVSQTLLVLMKTKSQRSDGSVVIEVHASNALWFGRFFDEFIYDGGSLDTGAFVGLPPRK